VGAGGAYATIDPGPHTLTGRIAAATDKDLAVSSVNTTIEDGKYYSFYMSGFYNTTTKTVEGFVVEDNFPIPTDLTEYIRLPRGATSPLHRRPQHARRPTVLAWTIPPTGKDTLAGLERKNPGLRRGCCFRLYEPGTTWAPPLERG